MYQSPSRNNFLDILIEPTTIAILASITIHAMLGAGLPFFTQLEKVGKKPEPGTVKVVELSPSELQRIPQAPPIPAPEVLPPATQPIPPASQSAPPPISPNSKTVPFSPIRLPLDNVTPTPTPGQKDQQAIPQKQPKPPNFISKVTTKPKPIKPSTAKPKSKPNQSSDPQEDNIKSSPTPVPTEKPKVLTVPLPSSSSTVPVRNGSETLPATPTVRNPQSQSPTGSSPQTSVPANSNSPASSSSQSPANSSGSGSGNVNGSDYGRYTQDVAERVRKYTNTYPNIKLYSPQPLLQKYPAGTPCPTSKQPPFIVLMVGFDKLAEGQDRNILGDNTSQPLDNKKSFVGDRQILDSIQLLNVSVTAGFVAATEAEKNRPAADKGVPVLYQYRVQFDPTTCIK
jgi:hypothetical protein